jgi:hypothetical protein
MTGSTDLALQGADGLVDRINAAHEEVKNSVRSGIGLMIKVGDLLLQAKAGLAHGSFLDWVGEHCTCTPRTAQLYMKLAKDKDKLLQSNTKGISHLTLTEAMKMLGPLKQELPKDPKPKTKADPVAEAIKKDALAILQRAWVAAPEPHRRQFMQRIEAQNKPAPSG